MLMWLFCDCPGRTRSTQEAEELEARCEGCVLVLIRCPGLGCALLAANCGEETGAGAVWAVRMLLEVKGSGSATEVRGYQLGRMARALLACWTMSNSRPRDTGGRIRAAARSPHAPHSGRSTSTSHFPVSYFLFSLLPPGFHFIYFSCFIS